MNFLNHDHSRLTKMEKEKKKSIDLSELTYN